MSTFLFDSIIFGPVRSRRLGVSLGINLLPCDRKVCSFDCIYCECGWTPHGRSINSPLPSRTDVREELRTVLTAMRTAGEKPDVITYAGNGEPTMHPDFAGIIDDSVTLRNEFFPEAKISVLSNASGIHRKSVREALMKVDMNILKLDSAFLSTVATLNRPRKSYDLAKVIESMKLFNGKFIIQTLFVRGEHEGKTVDNSAPEEVEAWLEIVRTLNPESVMIYTIERDTPLGKKLHKVPLADLKVIAARVEAAGIRTSVSG
ncbi:MAG TPA: hypothetical protein VMV74_05870 [Bacteroidales bacterium]|nr:hypothetical protein [Bacteroidales bacterium]